MTVTIVTAAGAKDVPAEQVGRPGLIAANVDGGWALTHVPSGFRVGWADQLSTIREFVNRVGPLTDWTQPKETLEKVPELMWRVSKIKYDMLGEVK